VTKSEAGPAWNIQASNSPQTGRRPPNFSQEVASKTTNMLRSLLVLCVAALAAPAAAFAPASVPTLRSARAPAISMQAVQERTQVDILDKGAF